MNREKVMAGSVRVIIYLFFILTSLGLILVGAKIYGQIGESTQLHFNMRTPSAYLSMKIRQNDCVNGVTVKELEGRDALVLTEWADEVGYETWIYYDEGYLKEAYVEKGENVTLIDGMNIMPLTGFEVDFNRSTGIVNMVIRKGAGDPVYTKVALRGNGK